MPATVTITGTVTQPRVKTLQQGGVGTTYGPSGGTDSDSRTGIQKDLNFYQELQNFVAEMARVTSMSAPACIAQLIDMLSEMRRQPAMGERIFAP
jgi:hypothetical protein